MLTSLSGIIWISTLGASDINFSVKLGLRINLRLLITVLPITILVTQERRAYSAIWKAISSPHTIAIDAPIISAKWMFVSNLSESSDDIDSETGVFT